MKFERNYFVHYYDIDLKKRLMITALLRYFEDLAILQSENAKIGLEYYKKNSVAWVLYKWKVDIKKYPSFGDEIKVITEPRAFVRFYAYRTFEVRAMSEELLASATSLWFFVDTNTRKPVKISDEMIKGYRVQNSDVKSLEIEELRPMQRTDFEKYFNVRLSDIDTNNHVNNISYIDWALEVIPPEVFEEYSLRHLKVVYKKETNYGSRVKSTVELNKEFNKVICLHKIVEDENELCIIETIWEKE
jgi:medium-chain acyl-[acyl-carrier-protein] hydrolase